MKIVMIIYHSEFHEELTALVEAQGVFEYIEAPQCWGIDETGRHVDTHVWPGTDSFLMSPLPEPTARAVVDALRAWKASNPQNSHVRILVLPVEECY